MTGVLVVEDEPQLLRALTELYQGEVWASWLTLGGIFVAVGGFLWAKRNA